MAKIEFTVTSNNKHHNNEADEDLYERILNLNATDIDLQEEDENEDNDDLDDESEDYSDLTEIDGRFLGIKLTNRLREELSKAEYNRDYLRFKYRGEILEGVPMHELNPGKFIFNINGKLRGINLVETTIL